jgi:stearoyl-CoA desaturase (delta-9 desaturase)
MVRWSRSVSDAELARTLRKSAPLRRRQRLHAAALTLLPPVGALAALALARHRGVHATEVTLLVAMYGLTMAGLTVGFHRALAHRSFETHPWMRTLLACMGSLAAQGPVLYWVANHRRHHELSDRPGDLHSPIFDGERRLSKLRGLWHAHVGWNFDHDVTNVVFYARDLLRERNIVRVSQRYYLIVLLGLLAPALIGGCGGTWGGMAAGFLWGGPLRIFLIYHATASINSITHAFGRRAFKTKDESRNVWWLAIFTLGESWHNNHHAFPSSAWFGLRWFQVDLGALIIESLRRIGLARDLKAPPRGLAAAKALDDELMEDL